MSVKRSGEPWSSDELAQLESMMSQKIHLKQIAYQLGRTEGAVRTRFAALMRDRNGPRGTAKRDQRRRNGASFFLS